MSQIDLVMYLVGSESRVSGILRVVVVVVAGKQSCILGLKKIPVPWFSSCPY